MIDNKKMLYKKQFKKMPQNIKSLQALQVVVFYCFAHMRVKADFEATGLDSDVL